MEKEYFLSTLISSSISKTKAIDTKLKIRVVQEHQLLNHEKSDSVGDVISSINLSLGSSRTRLSGLIALHLLLEQCHGDVLLQNASPWTRSLLTVLQSRDPPDVKSCACEVMESLVSHIQAFPESSRDFASSALSSVLAALLAAEENWKNAALQCLVTCMRHFPGGCLSVKTKIEQLVLTDIDHGDSRIRKLAMRVYSLLPVLGGGGSGGVRHTDNWAHYMDRLMSSLHGTMDVLYTGIEEDDVYNRPDIGVTYWHHRAEGLEKYNASYQRLSTLVQGVKYMLRTEVQTAVQVPVKGILLVVQRIVAVTPEILMSRPTTERTLLATLLPFLYKEALSLTTSLLCCVTSHMIPYASVVNRCLVQVLAATNTSASFGVTRPYGSTRIAVYKCMQVWLETLGANTGLEYQADNLIRTLADDIRPQRDTIKNSDTDRLAEIAQELTHRHKKKGSKRAGSANVGQISSQRKLCLTANADVCSEALRTLGFFIKTCGPLIQGKYYVTLHELILPLAFSLQPTAKAVPYVDADCRAALYGLIETVVVNTHHQVAPPTTCAVALFTSALGDANVKVRQVCRNALVTMETLCHPRAPSLHFPFPVPQQIQDGRPPITKTNDVSELPSDKHRDFVMISDTSCSMSLNMQTMDSINETGSGAVASQTLDSLRNEDDVARSQNKTTNGSRDTVETMTSDVGKTASDRDSAASDAEGTENSDVSDSGASAEDSANALRSTFVQSVERDREIGLPQSEGTESLATDTRSLSKDTGSKSKDTDSDIAAAGTSDAASDVKRRLDDVTEEVPPSKKPCQEEDSDDAVEMLLADFVDSQPDEI